MEYISSFTASYKVILILSYLLGSIPFGLIITKLAGFGDIRAQGSGNIGATNVLRAGGKKLGVLTLLMDFSKGFLAVYIAKKYCPYDELFLLSGALSIIGHIFPIWLKFKGGKGVASAIGVFMACEYEIGLFLIICWLITFKIARISSLSAIVAFILTPVFTYFYSDINLFYLVTTISILVICRHYDNIYRLINNQEKASKL
jgi:glycerol-3-phosphate acyltransferase PlsY